MSKTPHMNGKRTVVVCPGCKKIFLNRKAGGCPKCKARIAYRGEFFEKSDYLILDI